MSLEHPHGKRYMVCTEKRYEALNTCILPVITAMMITHHGNPPEIPKRSFKELLERDDVIKKQYNTLKSIVFNVMGALPREALNYKNKTKLRKLTTEGYHASWKLSIGCHYCCIAEHRFPIAVGSASAYTVHFLR